MERKPQTITLGQRSRLLDWCKGHKDDTRTYPDLAVQATEDLGFPVTRASLQNHWTAVNGPRRQTTGTQFGIAALADRVAALTGNVDALDKAVRHLWRDFYGVEMEG